MGYAIEELYPDRLAEHYEELAHHFAQGEDWAKAFEYLVRSGDRARDANASPVALELYAPGHRSRAPRARDLGGRRPRSTSGAARS